MMYGTSMMDRFFFGGGFEVMFFAVFGLFMVVFVGTLLSGLRTWHKNNQSPRLTVDATVVTKRDRIVRRGGQHHGHHTYTYYYVTFEVDSGDRMELGVEDAEYGLLVEGDRGRLTFQGTRFLGFERTY